MSTKSMDVLSLRASFAGEYRDFEDSNPISSSRQRFAQPRSADVGFDLS